LGRILDGELGKKSCKKGPKKLVKGRERRGQDPEKYGVTTGDAGGGINSM